MIEDPRRRLRSPVLSVEPMPVQMLSGVDLGRGLPHERAVYLTATADPPVAVQVFLDHDGVETGHANAVP